MPNFILTHFLHPHNLEPIHSDLVPFVANNTYAIPSLLLIGFLLYAFWVRKNTSSLIANVLFLYKIQSFFKSFKYNKEPQFSISGKILIVLCFSTFIYLIRSTQTDGIFLNTEALSVHPDNLFKIQNSLFLYSLFFSASYFCLKWAVQYITAYIFDEHEFGVIVSMFDVSYLLSWIIPIFPLLLVSVYLPINIVSYVLYISAFLYIIIRIFYIIRVIVSKQKLSEFSYLHIFLYLCTLELLPFLCFYKIFFL